MFWKKRRQEDSITSLRRALGGSKGLTALREWHEQREKDRECYSEKEGITCCIDDVLGTYDEYLRSIGEL